MAKHMFLHFLLLIISILRSFHFSSSIRPILNLELSRISTHSSSNSKLDDIDHQTIAPKPLVANKMMPTESLLPSFPTNFLKPPGFLPSPFDKFKPKFPIFPKPMPTIPPKFIPVTPTIDPNLPSKPSVPATDKPQPVEKPQPVPKKEPGTPPKGES